jgi:hypothetical protein
MSARAVAANCYGGPRILLLYPQWAEHVLKAVAATSTDASAVNNHSGKQYLDNYLQVAHKYPPIFMHYTTSAKRKQQ